MTTITVYLKSGQTFSYEVSNGEKAREHAYAIWMGGYRHNDGSTMEWYGPHWIDKIKISPAPGTAYLDKQAGT